MYLYLKKKIPVPCHRTVVSKLVSQVIIIASLIFIRCSYICGLLSDLSKLSTWLIPLWNSTHKGKLIPQIITTLSSIPTLSVTFCGFASLSSLVNAYINDVFYLSQKLHILIKIVSFSIKKYQCALNFLLYLNETNSSL